MSKKTIPEIKPCPFCGGKAEIRIGYHYGNDGFEISSSIKCFIICLKCLISTKGELFKKASHITNEHKIDIINSWNERVE